MSILRIFACTCLAVTTLTVLHAETHCPGNVASVPLRQVQGALIVVSLTVNGAGPFDFLVDTGAQTATVDEPLASQLNLRTMGTTGVSGAATYARKTYVEFEKVEVAGLRVTHVLAVIDNLSQLHAADSTIRGILGEDFLAHFDLMIDNKHHILCLDETGVMAAAMKGIRVPLVQPYGPDHDLPYTRPLVIEARLDGIKKPVLFRLDSGSNVPLIYAGRYHSPDIGRADAQILKRVVEGAEQDFVVLEPKDVTVGSEKVRQVTFVQPMISIGATREAREDGLLPTQLFQSVLVSYRNQFAILNPR